MPDLALDLRYLRYAIIAAEHGSFRRAAEALNVSQSTVSRRIQILERRLGAPLFVRLRTGIRPTRSGERFLREAATGADHLRQAAQAIAAVKHGGAGDIRVGLVASLAQGFLATLLAEYHRRFPSVTVEIDDEASETNVAGVLNGRLDVAFVTGIASVPRCSSCHLWDERIYIAVPSSHKLAAEKQISWSQVRNEVFLVSAGGPGPEIENYLISKLSGLGFRPRIHLQRVGRDNLVNLVACGFGVTLTTESTRGTGYRGVAFIPVEGASEIVSSSVLWRDANDNPALKGLLDLSRELRSTRSPRPTVVGRG
ncbi:LysR family transcriptional regulator [Ancylobacter pratisalsi]|uniref:LysR family transcriptional regulator n=1 Tax=Ancylobacter pratisalsi TaxID=1745854 RepID=A0A6P1YT63_9HYPH|nr:LysR family transcriptional regulator [Ancylobacter pratisalsi]QIB35263.1 LysR family transcriptional regulator [Ancylobacter pratisalsi]